MAPGRWSVAEVARGGEVVARLPFVVRGPRRLRVLTQPPLTQFLGPWVSTPPDAKPATALSDEMRLQTELERALPAAAAFRQNFSPAMTGLSFVWAGYRNEARYTYRLEDLSCTSTLWDGLAGNIRANMGKARRRVAVRSDLGLDRLHAVWAKTSRRQGLPRPDHATLERIEAACAPRNARTMVFAVDDRDRVHAAVYLVCGGGVRPTTSSVAATPIRVGRDSRRQWPCKVSPAVWPHADLGHHRGDCCGAIRSLCVRVSNGDGAVSAGADGGGGWG